MIIKNITYKIKRRKMMFVPKESNKKDKMEREREK